MVKHLIVPVDGSSEAWVAFDVARLLAARCGADIRVVHVTFESSERQTTHDRLEQEINGRGPFDVEVTLEVRLAYDSVSEELDQVLDLRPDSVIVMASHGRGRSAAIVGSITENMLRRSYRPLVLVGPNVEPGDFSGPVVVTVDGSDESEFALPLAAGWASMLRTTPWIVNVTGSTTPPSTDTLETAYSAHLAHELSSFTGNAVEFDQLHGSHPAVAVADYASRHDASLIVASSHGRSGLSRLTMGSVVSGFVRHAACPVVVVKLPRPERAATNEVATRVQGETTVWPVRTL